MTCRVKPAAQLTNPPGLRNSSTARTVFSYSSDVARGWVDKRYLANVSSNVGTGSRGRELWRR